MPCYSRSLMKITTEGGKNRGWKCKSYLKKIKTFFYWSGVLPWTKPYVLPSGFHKSLGFNVSLFVCFVWCYVFSLAEFNPSFNLDPVHAYFQVEVHPSQSELDPLTGRPLRPFLCQGPEAAAHFWGPVKYNKHMMDEVSWLGAITAHWAYPCCTTHVLTCSHTQRFICRVHSWRHTVTIKVKGSCRAKYK